MAVNGCAVIDARVFSHGLVHASLEGGEVYLLNHRVVRACPAEVTLEGFAVAARLHEETFVNACALVGSEIVARTSRGAAIGVRELGVSEEIPLLGGGGVGVAVAEVGLAHCLAVGTDVILEEGVKALRGQHLAGTCAFVCGQILPLGFSGIAIPRADEHAVVEHVHAVFVGDGLVVGRSIHQELHVLAGCPISSFLESLGACSLIAKTLNRDTLAAGERGRTLVVGQVGVGVGIAVVPNGKDDVAATAIDLNAHVEAVLADGHGVGAHVVVACGNHHLVVEPVAARDGAAARTVPHVRGGRREVGGQIGGLGAFLVEFPIRHTAKPAAGERQIKAVIARYGKVDAIESRYFAQRGAFLQTDGPFVNYTSIGKGNPQVQHATIYTATCASLECGLGPSHREMDVLHAMARARVGPGGQLARVEIGIGIGRAVDFVIAAAGCHHIGRRLVILRAAD